MTIKLGDKCKDKITGVTGICTAITECLHGCRRITIQPQELLEGKVQDQHWFDEPQVEVLETAAYKVPEMKKPGGLPGRIPTSKPPKR